MLISSSVWFQLDIENNSGQKVWQEMEFVLGKGLLKLFLNIIIFGLFLYPYKREMIMHIISKLHLFGFGRCL